MSALYIVLSNGSAYTEFPVRAKSLAQNCIHVNVTQVSMV